MRHLRSLALAALPALLLTGCSGQTDETASAAPTSSSAAPLSETFDLQAHRGGRGEWTENSSGAFDESLRLGVTTLELDVVLSADGVPVVWHDPVIDPEKCSDTAPAAEGDGQFPYVGKPVHDLTYAQLQTLNCNGALADFPDAEHTAANSLIQLADVYHLADSDPEVRFNVETKIEAEEPEKSATPQEFVDAIVPVIQDAGAVDRTTVQSFDWRSLPLVTAAEPRLGTVMLYDETTWRPGSAWTGKIDYDAVDGSVARAAAELKANALSPDYELVDAELVREAHAADLPVIPWTVNERADMERMLDLGVDGMITDYPTRLRDLLEQRDVAFRHN